ncbi:krueppel like ous 1 [Fusarium mexicanum]|uniref:Krueppel like ous 1 n=1 Tax=Fusarium mexicanum TaxID=751941 RepID=A0A8H5IHP9_9HYPO|nr:krueppel like ous 1 [Fusarium mexicanum]
MQDQDSIWMYDPSFPLAVVGTVVYGIIFLAIAYLTLIKYRAWYFIVVVIGSAIEVAAYNIRIHSVQNQSEITPFVLTLTYTVLAPVLIAAGNYLLISRLILAVLPTSHHRIFRIPGRRLTPIFVFCDVIAFLIQGSGSGIASSDNWQGEMENIGVKVLIVGLVFQLAAFSLFLCVFRRFHVLALRMAVEDAPRGWQKVVLAVYISSILIMEAELSRYHELKDNTITLDQPRKRELKNQSDIVDGCANACLDVQIILLDRIGNSTWTSLPESVQNVLSIKFPGSEYLVLKVQFGVEDLKTLPVATPARPQAASAYVTPISLELPPTGQHAQSPGTADRGSVKRKAAKRKAAPVLSEALGSLPDLFKKPRLSGPDDDFVPSDDEAPEDLVDDDDAAAATAECLTPVVDDQGLIRIGPQPMKSQLWVQSASEERANCIIKGAVHKNHKITDSRFPNSNAGRLELAATKLRQHPSIALPLVSVWLNAYQEPDFNFQQRQCAWAFNALSNTMIMTRAFQAIGTHGIQINRWNSLGVDEQHAILEMQRTGTRAPEAENLLATASFDFLWATTIHPAPRRNLHGSSIYRNLKRIAESKGITAFEFEDYCTVLSPGRSKHRVFYPFHILSRPQADSIGWDWHILFQICRDMLYNMRRNCNKHAEKAGHGEAHVDAVRLIYWMGTWVCGQINRLKAEKSDKEEIAFSVMLDRWGLPIVPWKSHILQVSLCKKQDHGIAMIFGIEDAPDFDPVQHIDLTRATVTLDTGFTNMAMRNFNASSWDSLRTILMQVPLHHPFWKVDLSLGDNVWAGEWDRSIQPQAPTPEFQANLLSIEAWVDEQPRDPFACAYCGQTFNSAGRLVEHSRVCSRGIQGEQEAPNLEQDTADQEYWDSRYKCDICVICTFYHSYKAQENTYWGEAL